MLVEAYYNRGLAYSKKGCTDARRCTGSSPAGAWTAITSIAASTKIKFFNRPMITFAMLRPITW